MRLLTHNMLVCNVQACMKTANSDPTQGPLNFPLEINVAHHDDLVIEETFYSEKFLLHILGSIDWNGLRATLLQLGDARLPLLPEEKPVHIEQDQQLLKQIHSILFDTNVQNGALKCRNCERMYPIQNGVPDMLLESDEI